MTSQNKRIAKNTVFLYFRMLFMMALSFWTTREVLANLGVVDFGLSNVIGSVVTMFAFLANVMRAAASRYFAVSIGKGDSLELKQIFSLTLFLYLIAIIVLFLLLETIGFWVVGNKLVIPVDRLIAAKRFFHFSVAAFLVNTLAVPFSAMIVAKEDMGYFAALSIFDAIAKLAVAFCLIFAPIDRLSFYGLLMFVIGAMHFFLNAFVAVKKYPESRLIRYWNAPLFCEILKFSSWSMFAGLTTLFSDVLVNVVLNNFFGAVINAARGIALQVNSGANAFAENFLMAVRPGIMKLCAQKKYDDMIALTCNGAKYGFLLSMFVVIPIIIDADFILDLWLDDVPEGAVAFVSLIMIDLAINIFSNPLIAVAQASGKIAMFMTIIGVTIWTKLPFSYIVLRLGYPAESVIWVSIIISLVCLFLRLLIIRKIVYFPMLIFLKNVVIPTIAIALISLPLPFYLHSIMQPSIVRLASILFLNGICLCAFTYVFVMNSLEREKIKKLVLSKLTKKSV